MKFSHWRLTPQASMNFGLILMVLVLNGIVVHRNTVALHETHDSVIHTHGILTQAEQILALQTEAESGVRGYALTGDDSFLKPYKQAIRSLPDQLRALRASVSYSPVQTENAQQLETRINARMEHLRLVTTARAERGFAAARDAVATGVGLRTMNLIRETITEFKAEENRLLEVRTIDADRKLATVLIANFLAVCLGLLICGVAGRLINGQMRKCREAEANADTERENLLVTLTSIGDAVVVTDAEGRVQLLNPVAEKLMGDPPNPVGKRLLDVFAIVNELTRQPVENPVAKVLEVGEIVAIANHTLLLRPDGTEVPIEDSAAPIRNKAGQITGAVLVFRDCSERWRFERDLKERERRFRRMFETPLIGIAVGTSGGKYLLEANDAYLELIGYDRGELAESYLGWGGVDSGQSPLDESAQFELRETGVCRPFEKIYTRSDGTLVPVLISSTRLSDEEDRIIVFITDLSRSKRSEAALRDSESRFRILSESMPQMVWIALPDGQFDYVNQTLVEYSGRTTEELKGWGWTKLLHDEDREAHVAAWKVALAVGHQFEIEHRLLQRTGDYRWHLTRALPMYNADEQIALWIGTDTDIDDHKQVEALLKEEHKRKDQFLALLAHELRNPLAPLGNALQVFSAVQHDPVRSKELIAIMERQVRQMTRLIDDLLDLARITQGRILLRRERTLVATVVAAAVEAVQPWITEREHQLTVTLPPQELWIDADAARLSQVLTNLLQNAAKYTEPKGQIALTVECAWQEILFRVRDNGPGLSASMVTRIFDLFMQVEQTLNRAHGGLGIGLTLVRTLVELHGGRVTAHSEGLGHGSEFVVRLPLIAEPSPTVSSPATSPDATAARLPALNVLVVDDVQASARTLALMLSVLGQNAETAFDGLAAMAKVNDKTFDVVFLDIAMPGMDGLEVARKLRSNPVLSGMTLVALTGFGQDEDRHRSLDAGFNEHLVKPTSLGLLHEVLQRASMRKLDETADIRK